MDFSKGEFQVFDLFGTKLLSGEVPKTQSSIDVSKLQSGMYLLVIEQNGQIASRRFVKM